jgi:DNA repair protein RadC
VLSQAQPLLWFLCFAQEVVMRTANLAFGTLATKLRYGVPSIKLCLVHEGLQPEKLYAIQAPSDAEEYLQPLRHAPEEHFVSLHLNAKHEVIGVHEVSHGTLASSLVHPREVFKAALVSNSYALVVCHNHPSGSLVVPSSEDIDTTRQLIRAGKLLGINLIDHLIFSPNQRVYSIRENHAEIWKI